MEEMFSLAEYLVIELDGGLGVEEGVRLGGERRVAGEMG